MWDLLTNGTYVSDYWTNTPAIDAFTSTIPRCSGPHPAAPERGARRSATTKACAGQCTWWAINEFPQFTGRYPD